MQPSPVGRVGCWVVALMQFEEYKNKECWSCHPFYLPQSFQYCLCVMKACCCFPKETDFLCNTKLAKMSPLWKGEVILCSVWEKPFLSSDIVTATCLGAGILTLFLPLIEQQLPTDLFHLWVALVHQLFISLTFCPPSAFSPLCTAVCSCWLLGQRKYLCQKSKLVVSAATLSST